MLAHFVHLCHVMSSLSVFCKLFCSEAAPLGFPSSGGSATCKLRLSTDQPCSQHANGSNHPGYAICLQHRSEKLYLTGICQIIYKLGYVFKGGGQRWFHKISCTPVEPRGFRWKDSPASLVFACCLVILYIFQPIPSRLSLFSLVTISSCFVATIGFVLKKSSCCLVISWSNGCRA